jgi:hypothetical protein
MGPRFNKIALLGNGDLLVEGPFETHGEVVDDVLVRFLIIPDGSPNKISGTATLAKSAVITSGPPPDVVSKGTFSATVPGSGLAVGVEVRAIGILVAVKRADPPDPPAFETFTWCVTFKVTGDQAQAA